MEFLQYITPTDYKRHVVEMEAGEPGEYRGIGLLEFIERMNHAIETLAPGLDFEPAYPETVRHYEDHADKFRTTITWDVYHMSPHVLGGKALPNPSSGTRETKPRLRKEIVSRNGQHFMLSGQMLQTFLKFDIWALTGKEAEVTANWFQHNLMAHYSHQFGSPHCAFYERSRDQELRRINNQLQTRSLLFYVQLEENTVEPVSIIEQVTTRIHKESISSVTI